MSKPWLRIIGDVHGRFDEYVKLANEAEYSLQVGDLGFDYDCLKQLDPARHKVLAGNHENYGRWGTEKFIHMQSGHWLGDFGIHEVPDFGKIFFVRGGFSIDFRYRKEGVDWFRDEELSYNQMQEALALFGALKPDFMFSHECPTDIAQAAWGDFYWDGELIRPSMTAKLLQQMWSLHAPKHWLFGHHHKVWSADLCGGHTTPTKFRCVPELGFVDFDKDTKEIVRTDGGVRV
jgi:hypothetical protein